mgnify:CR=1 FL=1
MVLYCIIIGLAVYYLALWGWYRHVAVNNRTVSQPERKKRENTASLVGESRFRSGLMRTNGDILGHFPQAVENDTTFAPDAGGEDEETDFEMKQRKSRTMRTRKSPGTWQTMKRDRLRV